MGRYKCDLHIHSCLSPCGDNDMTPGNIAGMSVLNGLQIVALTDHNSAKNCPSFFKWAKEYGLIAIAGMELTTSEDIHLVCLFRSLAAAMEFDSLVEKNRPKIKNKPGIFGNQLIINENDEVCGEDDYLLISSSGFSIDEAFHQVIKHDGVCFPAHIDRTSGGIITALGDFPPEPNFTAFELNDINSLEDSLTKYPIIVERGLVHVASSDAHYLTDISEVGFEISLPDEPYSSDFVRQRLIDYLLGLDTHTRR